MRMLNAKLTPSDQDKYNINKFLNRLPGVPSAQQNALSEYYTSVSTAAVITPVGEVKARTGDFTVGDGTPGPLAMSLREALLDIQHGRVADSHGWLHRVG